MSFAAQMEGYSKRTKANLQKVRRAVTIKLFNAVVMDTPVDKGRLRGNWRCSEDIPDHTADNTVDPSGSATTAAVETVVGKSDGDKPLFLANSLPYAHRIEFDGYSQTKAPEGMVRKNVARFQGIVQAEAANV